MTNLYLDGDGVEADFDNHVLDLFGELPSVLGDEKLWSLVEATPRFWLDMPLMPDAYVLWNAVSHLQPTVLTGCPKTGYERAAEHKAIWYAKHFGVHVRVITCLSRNKPKYMENPGDILVDDMLKNTNRWERAGGVSILHSSAVNTITKLQQMNLI